MVDPPLTFYVDESGTPSFGRKLKTSEGRAYVTAAVAVPTGVDQAVLGDLICDSSGHPVKPSDLRISDQSLMGVVSRLLSKPLGIGMVVVDRTGLSSISTAKWVAERMSADPRHRSRRALKPPVASYIHLVMDAIINCWGSSENVLGYEPTYIDVVLDEFSMPSGLRSRMRDALVGSASKNGLHIREVTWTNEQTHPLLCVPDFLASVLRRGLCFGDHPLTLAALEHAHTTERISIQDGKRFQT